MKQEALTPVAPTDPGGRDSRDQTDGGYDLLSLERLVRDTHEQPDSWRQRSDLCHAYYDGKQLTEDQQRTASYMSSQEGFSVGFSWGFLTGACVSSILFPVIMFLLGAVK